MVSVLSRSPGATKMPLIGAVFCILLVRASSRNYGHRARDPSKPVPTKILSPLPEGPVPDELLWNNVSGVNYLTLIRNQHIPQYCGSCWAFSATSALSDRIKIARHAQWPDVSIAPQVLLSCAHSAGKGCHGGEAPDAFEWMAKNDIGDETCSIYQAKGWTTGLGCGSMTLCETCSPDEGCSAVNRFYKFGVEEYGPVKGTSPEDQEKNMMAEIANRGPIACGIAVTRELENYDGGGIFEDKSGDLNIVHDISVVGYGVDRDSGQKYWLIRNSWGTYWGEKGMFRLVRGKNNLGIESGTCSWATPDLKDIKVFNAFTRLSVKSPALRPPMSKKMTISELFTNLLMTIAASRLVTDAKLKNEFAVAVDHHPCVIGSSKDHKFPKPKSPSPSVTVSTSELPEYWDWRNVDGTNYLSWNVNQHIPKYCGSCWAQGTLSALADRFIIANKKRFANLALSPQAIINCRAGGSCNGGLPATVYEFAATVGIPDVTCMQYDANNDGPASHCEKPGIEICRNCKPGETAESTCWAVQNFTRYYAADYGTVSGIEDIKKEIYKRGPVACVIDATNKFWKYSGGIFDQRVMFPILNHLISVVGWGYDRETQTPYWIGRNSWGTYWGEQGFFRLSMKHDLGLHKDCVWAVPRV